MQQLQLPCEGNPGVHLCRHHQMNIHDGCCLTCTMPSREGVSTPLWMASARSCSLLAGTRAWRRAKSFLVIMSLSRLRARSRSVSSPATSSCKLGCRLPCIMMHGCNGSQRRAKCLRGGTQCWQLGWVGGGGVCCITKHCHAGFLVEAQGRCDVLCAHNLALHDPCMQAAQSQGKLRTVGHQCCLAASQQRQPGHGVCTAWTHAQQQLMHKARGNTCSSSGAQS